MNENPRFLTEQLITYLGNKRSLLPFIGQAVAQVQSRLGKERISSFDVFSGSGIVARYLKQHSSFIAANDIEPYAGVINRCYLSNREEIDFPLLEKTHARILEKLNDGPLDRGLIAELYAPDDDENIRPGERVFYTARNARYLDTARRLIGEAPESLRDYLLAPLLSEASVHANTSGVFKGFYKNSHTGIGKFGGRKGDALLRILGDITLPPAVFSNFACETRILCEDASTACASIPEVDLAYLDPPYNQHPYGSNYFMLNLLVDYQKPERVSPISGIPPDWQRSLYNKKRFAAQELDNLAGNLRTKYLLVSFNSEGFIRQDEMTALLARHGKVDVMETRYNAFRGSRNLSGRALHVREFLYLVEKY